MATPCEVERDMDEKAPQHIKADRQHWYWDWWRENPVEIILVIFILVLFAAVPWQGCGISGEDGEEPEFEVERVVP